MGLLGVEVTADTVLFPTAAGVILLEIDSVVDKIVVVVAVAAVAAVVVA